MLDLLKKGQRKQTEKQDAKGDIGQKEDAVGPTVDLIGNLLEQIGDPQYPRPGVGDAKE